MKSLLAWGMVYYVLLEASRGRMGDMGTLADELAGRWTGVERTPSLRLRVRFIHTVKIIRDTFRSKHTSR